MLKYQKPDAPSTAKHSPRFLMGLVANVNTKTVLRRQIMNFKLLLSDSYCLQTTQSPS